MDDLNLDDENLTNVTDVTEEDWNSALDDLFGFWYVFIKLFFFFNRN